MYKYIFSGDPYCPTLSVGRTAAATLEEFSDIADSGFVHCHLASDVDTARRAKRVTLQLRANVYPYTAYRRTYIYTRFSFHFARSAQEVRYLSVGRRRRHSGGIISWATSCSLASGIVAYTSAGPRSLHPLVIVNYSSSLLAPESSDRQSTQSEAMPVATVENWFHILL